MFVQCPGCGKPVRVADTQDPVGDRKAKCMGCRNAFRIAGARPADPPPGSGQIGRTTGRLKALADGAGASAPGPSEDPLAPGKTSPSLAVLPLSGSTGLASRTTARRIPVIGQSPAETSGAIGAPGGRPTGRFKVAGPNWKVCAGHPDQRSEFVCEQCGQGFCAACVKQVQQVRVCLACERPCIEVAEREREEATRRLKARSMWQELPVILSYPFVDPASYVILSILVGLFSLARGVGGGIYAVIFVNGLLMAYSLTALTRVSRGNLGTYMPDMGDIGDFIDPVRLGFAVFLVSAGPMILALLKFPGVWSVFFAALVWYVAYAPVAMMAAAISRSFFGTLDPRPGVAAIGQMGATYWQATGLYTAILLAQWLSKLFVSFIPFAGGLAAPFIDSYASLVIGCTLGFALFKKASELGLD